MAHSNPAIQSILESRYFLRDETGKLLESDPSEMFARVAVAVAKAEKEDNIIGSAESFWQQEFFNLMADNKFLPNTPLLISAGKNYSGVTFAACNVLDIPDSMDGIFDTLKKGAIIFKYGGGLGIDFSSLREKNALVSSTGHASSGPLSFMCVYNEMTNCVAQAGVRRGGILAGFRVDHPDILEFISCKDKLNEFTNFNLSVIITDKFMEAVKDDSVWWLCSPLDRDDPFSPVETVKARDLWDKIVEHAWKTGEPGLIFIDEANRQHPYKDKKKHEIKCYNLCGEVNLEHAESCTLGSINLMAYIKEDSIGKPPYTNYWFDWDTLAEDIPTMVRFLDDVIDVNPYPLPEIEDVTKKSRKIGLGIMGWADCLIKMKIPYDSDEAIKLAEELMALIANKSREASHLLAIEKGNFPAWEESTYIIPMRNLSRNAIAPTGTLSRICGCSGGIEPNFAWQTHHKLEGHEYDEVHPVYAEREKEEGGKLSWPLPKYMKTSNDIEPIWHLKMQAAFQKYTDNSVSKTINLPTESTIDDVSKIYMWAWENKLKGITIYRNNSRENQPLNKIITLDSYKDPRFPVTDEDIINQPSPLQEVIDKINFEKFNENISRIKQKIYDEVMFSSEEEKEIIANSSDSYLPGKYNYVITEPYKEQPTQTITVTNNFSRPKDTQDTIKDIREYIYPYRKRGPITVGVTHKIDTNKGKAYITINYSEYHDVPVEIFVRLGYASTASEQAMAEYIGRLISVMLKYNLPLECIVKQGEKVYGDVVFWYMQKSFTSLPKLISHLLGFTFEEALAMAEIDIDSMLDNGNDVFYDEAFSNALEPLPQNGDYCYKCQTYSVINEGGCKICTNCLEEKCGG
jgi:ribonucleoside-diphosphate reductase alpha chain